VRIASRVATVALSSAVLVTPAAAQEITVNGTCFVNAKPTVGAPVTVSGTGFTPGDGIGLSATTTSGMATVAADGTFVTTVPGPILSTPFPAASRFTLTARDETNVSTVATTSFYVANLAFETSPSSAKPSTPVRFSFSGFGPHAILYGHYVRGKRVVTHRFGRTHGPCGMLKAKAQLFPGGHPQFGNYKVQFDDSRSYRPSALPRIVSALTIQRF
jgi:hypothetical protein